MLSALMTWPWMRKNRWYTICRHLFFCPTRPTSCITLSGCNRFLNFYSSRTWLAARGVSCRWSDCDRKMGFLLETAGSWEGSTDESTSPLVQGEEFMMTRCRRKNLASLHNMNQDWDAGVDQTANVCQSWIILRQLTRTIEVICHALDGTLF